VVVDHITNEIVTMVLATIDEQFKKLILLDDEHDLILFKPVDENKCIDVLILNI